MTISKDQNSQLRFLGFKLRNKNRYSYLTPFNQFLSINVLNKGFQLEIDGCRIYSNELSFNELMTILTLLYPNEKRKRVRNVN